MLLSDQPLPQPLAEVVERVGDPSASIRDINEIRKPGADPITMSDDPFMPAARRFPRDAWPPTGSDEPTSGLRPFVLRAARQVPSVITAKHRTAPHQTPQTDTTTDDGRQAPDTWYTPDD